MNETKSNQTQAKTCGTCGGSLIGGICSQGCKKQEAKAPKWMTRSIRRIELNQ